MDAPAHQTRSSAVPGLIFLMLWFGVGAALSSGKHTPTHPYWIGFATAASVMVVTFWLRSVASRPRVGDAALPAGFIARSDERVIYSSIAECHLPTTQTHTYGFAGGFVAAESDARTVTDKRGAGTLTVTNKRVVVTCGSDVREWPVDAIVGSYASDNALGSTLNLRVANVGAAKFAWRDRRNASAAADAVRIAATGEA